MCGPKYTCTFTGKVNMKSLSNTSIAGLTLINILVPFGSFRMWIGDQIDNKCLQSRTIHHFVLTQHLEFPLPEASGSQFACICEAHGFSLETLSAVMKVRIMLTALPKVLGSGKNSR
jgi:hypothetical protein